MEVEFGRRTGHQELTAFVLTKSEQSLEGTDWAVGDSKKMGLEAR
jgi:hypothetical protein